jgi:hypothetical protein
MLTAPLLLLLLVACGTTASSEQDAPDPAELQATIGRLQTDLTTATERSETLAEEVNELRAAQDTLQERVDRLERENARLQASLDEILALTDSVSPEDAVAEVESLLIEVDSLRELAEDQRFLQDLLQSLGRGPAPKAQPSGPTERAPVPPRLEPEEPEPGAPARPLTELPDRAPRADDAEPQEPETGTPAPPTRVLGGFVRVDRVESTFAAGAQALPEDRRISVTADRPRTYLPTMAVTDAAVVAPIVRNVGGRGRGDPEMALLVKVSYPASDPPLYLRGAEVSTQSTSIQISLPEVRRQSNGTRRLEEAIVTDPATVRRIVALLASERAVRISYHGNVRSIHEDAPRDTRGVVSVMVYVLRALGGDVPREGDQP